MDAINKIKKLAGETGHLKELTELFDDLWNSEPSKFRSVVEGTLKNWSKYEMIPIALRVIITRKDDPQLRSAVESMIELTKIDSQQKQFLCLVCGLWGEAWAKVSHSDYLNEKLQKAITGRSSSFSELFWVMHCGAMLQHYANSIDLEKLSQRLVNEGGNQKERIAFIETVINLNERGFNGLAEQLEHALNQKKATDRDVEACFVLGAKCDSDYAKLFGRIFGELSKSDMSSRALRRRALMSLSYCDHMNETTQVAIEDWLISEQKRVVSWWHGDSLTAEVMNISSILSNVEGSLRPKTMDVLKKLASSSHAANAREATALLSLKGVEVPFGTKFSADDRQVKSARDFLLHDSMLNFSYYWRTKQEINPHASQHRS